LSTINDKNNLNSKRSSYAAEVWDWKSVREAICVSFCTSRVLLETKVQSHFRSFPHKLTRLLDPKVFIVEKKQLFEEFASLGRLLSRPARAEDGTEAEWWRHERIWRMQSDVIPKIWK
jgi:hypothetical protein